jgi:hypothetical protein
MSTRKLTTKIEFLLTSDQWRTTDMWGIWRTSLVGFGFTRSCGSHVYIHAYNCELWGMKRYSSCSPPVITKIKSDEKRWLKGCLPCSCYCVSSSSAVEWTKQILSTVMVHGFGLRANNGQSVIMVVGEWQWSVDSRSSLVGQNFGMSLFIKFKEGGTEYLFGGGSWFSCLSADRRKWNTTYPWKWQLLACVCEHTIHVRPPQKSNQNRTKEDVNIK